jgi:hypothetical protein
MPDRTTHGLAKPGHNMAGGRNDPTADYEILAVPCHAMPCLAPQRLALTFYYF